MNFISKIITSLFFIALVVMPSAADARQKRALVIGLGQQQDTQWAKINGDKDVILVRDMLRRADFRDIHTLVNQDATKHNIVKAFNTLISKSDRGDVVYIHFSGHGQQMTDFNGDETDDRDECWIPYDAYLRHCDMDNGSRHLTDDEINALLHRLKAKVGTQGNILVVVDACHSGDSSRGSDEVYRGARDVFYADREALADAPMSNDENWIIVSACRDYQRNAELVTSEGRYGKLTYALCSIIGSGASMNNYQLYKRLCRFFDMNRGRLQQTPVIKGPMTRFNITDIL